jgi:CRP/FNR family cyclic AMP-dependent transcriptional regulator
VKDNDQHTSPGIPALPLDRVAELLATAPLFRELDRDALRALALRARDQRVPAGAVVMAAGEPPEWLSLLRTGRAELSVPNEGGEAVRLQELHPGAVLGELSMLTGRAALTQVVATAPATLLQLRRSDLRRLMDEQPRVAWHLVRELARRLQRADATIGSLVLLDVPGRVARLLLEQAPTGEPATLVRPFTHRGMAKLVGARRETVTRALARFRAAGYIRTERRVITIVNRRALETLAKPRAQPR